MKQKIVIFLLFFLASFFSFSQKKSDTTSLYLEFPLFDYPYQSYATKTRGNFFIAYANPSMNQSLAISNDLYSTVHWGIDKIIKVKNEFLDIFLKNLTAAGFDLLTFYTPLGVGWLHEEYHRAVLTRRGINSYNDMNNFPFGKTLVYVRKVKDEDLINLSDNHKQDFRRLMIAGNEGQFHQIQTLQKYNFYLNQDLPHVALYWMSTMINIGYLNQSGSDAFNKIIDKSNENDGADISKRDFTGADFTAWADALFFPDKPYEDRGIHPSGVGINRYIKPSQLSTEARSYLKKQGRLHWLNILSPHLFGFSKIKLNSTEKGDYYGNFAVRHLLTPFGNDISLDVFLQTPKNNFFFALHNYNNLKLPFFGLEFAIIDQNFFNDNFFLTGRCMAWVQPHELSFFTKKATFGAMFGVKGSYAFGYWAPYIAFEGKTDGWVMGNPFLDKNLSLNVGLEIRVP